MNPKMRKLTKKPETDPKNEETDPKLINKLRI